MYSSLLILGLISGLLRTSSSHPMDQRLYKDRDSIPIPLFVLSLPMEVDEPKSNVEDISWSPYTSGTKDKRTRLFPDNSDSCCPTVVEVIEPLGGKNRSGDLVELYQGDGVHQRFYEVSCAPSIADQHCKFLDKKHTMLSKCVQQYSYTYALVRDYETSYEDTVTGGWRLDYIQVRSGCSCQISQNGRHFRHSNT